MSTSLIGLGSVARAHDVVSPARETSDPRITLEEIDRPAAVDYGAGIGLPRPGMPLGFWRRLRQHFSTGIQSAPATPTASANVPAAKVATTNTPIAAAANMAAAPASSAVMKAAIVASLNGVPNGGSAAGTQGVFGTPITWPIIPIHLALLPDGRVLSYGTDETGAQGAALNYDVWDPTLGTDGSSHLELPNTTTTDIFCSAQSLMSNGSVLITGGDLTINGTRNFSNNKTNIFSPTANTLTASTSMQYPRWYPSLLTLPSGNMLVMGGRTAPYNSAILPEMYTSGVGFQTLTKANSWGIAEWYYPKAFVGPDGFIYLLNTDGRIFKYGTTGLGTFLSLGFYAAAGIYDLPTVMYSSGKLLSIRANNVVDLVDLTGTLPAVTTTASIPGGRQWASATLLADGTVFVNGGSSSANTLTGVSYASYIWSPTTGQWSLAGTATKPRLYHSNALLLPDGSVLTGGGGAPGPVNNLNGEIYYPPYLFHNDGTGNPAPRPVIQAMSAIASPAAPITITMQGGPIASRVTLLRAGSATHSTNLEQRFYDLGFSQSGSVITATAPGNANMFVPGYYMIFVFNAAGVPSLGRMIQVLPL